MTDLVSRRLAGVVAMFTALGCGAPDAPPPPAPRADTPQALERRPSTLFKYRSSHEDPRAHIGIRVGPTSLLILTQGDLLNEVNIDVAPDPCLDTSVAASTTGATLRVRTRQVSSLFLDMNMCRLERSPTLDGPFTQQPGPGSRIGVSRPRLEECSPQAPPAATPVTATVAYGDWLAEFVDVVRDHDYSHLAPFEGGYLIAPRYDGRLQWRGFVVDALGRPTDVWVEDPEPVLHLISQEEHDLMLLLKQDGASTRGCPAAVHPLRRLTAELRRPRRHAAIRIAWYDHVQLPFEIWSEGDGLAEGLYVAYADDGAPLVVGDHVLGARHGLWYYFGWRGSPRRHTVVGIDDYFLGEVRYSWRAPDDDRDPLQVLTDSSRR